MPNFKRQNSLREATVIAGCHSLIALNANTLIANDSSLSLSPKVMFFLQDCGATLRVAIHDAERRATMRLRRAIIVERPENSAIWPIDRL